MKASELRIGNYVNRKYLNPSPTGLKTEFEKCTVKAVGIENIIVEIKDKSYLKSEFYTFHFIKLTEEWLLKFGFEYSHILFDCKIYRKGIYYVSLSKGNISFGIKENQKSSYVPLKRLSEFYVHQLQNLYFALTGKELEIQN